VTTLHPESKKKDNAKGNHTNQQATKQTKIQLTRGQGWLLNISVDITQIQPTRNQIQQEQGSESNKNLQLDKSKLIARSNKTDSWIEQKQELNPTQLIAKSSKYPKADLAQQTKLPTM